MLPGKKDQKPELVSRIAFGALGVACSLAIWQGLAQSVQSSLILPQPAEVVGRFSGLLSTPEFWRNVGGTFFRVLMAFALSLSIGSIAGAISSLLAPFRYFFAPFMTIVRATPVLTLILIAMFWLPSGQVPILSAFLMAFPVAYTSIQTSFLATDKDLLEMAELFKVPPAVRLFRLRIPAARAGFLSAAKNSLGLCWKVVVAGEVLSQPARALGTGMQSARLSLETPSVFAWAVVTIILCGMSEYALGILEKAFGNSQKSGGD